MNICDLKCGNRAAVLRVECEEEESARLAGLGLTVGARLLLLKISPLRHTYLLQVGNTKLAVGREIARSVRIWPI